MPKSCSAVGCHNHSMMQSKPGMSFFNFPRGRSRPVLKRRADWIKAVNRITKDGDPWTPRKHSPLCSEHFVTGRPSSLPGHVDYLPSLFFVPTDGLPRAKTADLIRESSETRQQREAAKELWLQEMRARTDLIICSNPSPDGTISNVNQAAASGPSEDPTVEHSSKKIKLSSEGTTGQQSTASTGSSATTKPPPPPPPPPPTPPPPSAAFLKIQNERLRVGNGRLLQENTKLKEDLSKYKKVITKFVAIRKQMHILGIGLPGTGHRSGSESSTIGQEQNEILGQLTFKTEPDETLGVLNIAPIEETFDIDTNFRIEQVVGNYESPETLTVKIEPEEETSSGEPPGNNYVAHPEYNASPHEEQVLNIQPSSNDEEWIPQIICVYSAQHSDSAVVNN